MPSTEQRPIEARPPSATAAPRQVRLALAGLWAGAGSMNRPDGARATYRYATHPEPVPPNKDADRRTGYADRPLRWQVSLALRSLIPCYRFRCAGGGGRGGGGGRCCTFRWWRRTPRGGHGWAGLDQGIAVGLPAGHRPFALKKKSSRSVFIGRIDTPPPKHHCQQQSSRQSATRCRSTSPWPR
jgi:hypothetical protein